MEVRPMQSIKEFSWKRHLSLFLLIVASTSYAAPPTHRLVQTLDPASSEIFPAGQKGQPPDSLYFGFGLAMDGNTLLAGEPQANPPRVAVFTRSSDTSTWKRSATLVSPAKSMRSDFGHAIALAGNAALIASAESVYVFHKDSKGWQRTQRVAPPATDKLTSFPDAIALDADTAVITGNDAQGGIAYVYALQPNGTLTFKARLRSLSGSTEDGFGSSVALQNDTLAIGAPEIRSVFVFTRSGAMWKPTQQLTPADIARADDFGRSVAIDGGTLVVGAPSAMKEGTTGALQSGAAYIFSKSKGVYVERDVLHPSAAEHPDYEDYGRIVRLTHDRLVVWGHEELIFPMGCCESLAFTYQRSGSTVDPLGIARGVRGIWNLTTDGKQLIVAGDEDRQFHVGRAYVYDIRTAD